jgi:hypothetical protein
MHHLLVEDSAEKFGFFYCWAALQPGLEVFMIMDCMWRGHRVSELCRYQ